MGPAEKLETEFARVNKNPMNKIIHGIILVCFGFASFCLYGMLMLMEKCPGAGTALPWFSSCCFQLQSLCLWLPAIAAVYCVWMWFGKGPARATWTGVFVTITGLLVLMTFPTLVAVLLPLMNVILHLSAR
jgi:hypothetical protein